MPHYLHSTADAFMRTTVAPERAASSSESDESDGDNSGEQYTLDMEETSEPSSLVNTEEKCRSAKCRWAARAGSRRVDYRRKTAAEGLERASPAERLSNRTAADNRADGRFLASGTAGKGCECAFKFDGIEVQLKGNRRPRKSRQRWLPKKSPQRRSLNFRKAFSGCCAGTFWTDWELERTQKLHKE